MIVREQFRRAGGLADHLARLDTNKSVTVRSDLCQGVPPDIRQALVVLAGIARTNPRTKRHFIHFKISPSKPDARAIRRALDLIEKEYGIAPGSPRLVVEHQKGDRPNHFHVVYSIVDIGTGRAVPSEGNYLKDEIISRLLELELGEAITPGSRHADVVEALRDRGQANEAAVLAGVHATKAGARLGARRACNSSVLVSTLRSQEPRSTSCGPTLGGILALSVRNSPGQAMTW